MIINELKAIKFFCDPDDFIQAFNKKIAEHLLERRNPKSVKKPELEVSEMMCTEILYHLSGYKCFQYYYEQR